MNRPIKLKTIFFALVLTALINLLFWFVNGRQNTILLSADQLLKHQKSYTLPIEQVTISYIKRGEELPDYHSLYADYNDNSQKKLISKIQENNILVKHVGSVDKVGFSNPEFGFHIVSGIPLYSKVTTKFLIGSGSTVYEGYYVYFFGWHNVRIHLRGIS